jgi:hypothetical protein
VAPPPPFPVRAPLYWLTGLVFIEAGFWLVAGVLYGLVAASWWLRKALERLT